MGLLLYKPPGSVEVDMYLDTEQRLKVFGEAA